MPIDLHERQFFAKPIALPFVRAEVDRLLVHERVIEAIEFLLDCFRSVLSARDLVLNRGRYRVALSDFLLTGGETRLAFLTRTNPQFVHDAGATSSTASELTASDRIEGLRSRPRSRARET